MRRFWEDREDYGVAMSTEDSGAREEYTITDEDTRGAEQVDAT